MSTQREFVRSWSYPNDQRTTKGFAVTLQRSCSLGNGDKPRQSFSYQEVLEILRGDTVVAGGPRWDAWFFFFFSTSVYSKNHNFLVVTCQKKRFASLCLPWSNLLRRNTPCKNSTDVNLNNGGNTINGTHSLLFKRHHRAGALYLQLGSTDD